MESSLASPPFLHTLPGGALTPEQREFFDQNGYLVIPNFFSESDRNTIKSRFLSYTSSLPIPKRIQAVRLPEEFCKDGEGIFKLQQWEEDEVMLNFSFKSELIPYLKSFLGENIKQTHSMIVNKKPYTGAYEKHELHQNIAQYPFRPVDRIITTWTALNDVDENDGALTIIPGSHKCGVLEHYYPEGTNEFACVLPENLDKKVISVEMKAGDLMFFHSLLIHAPGINRTDGFRKAIICHFASSECEFSDIKGKSYEPICLDMLKHLRLNFFDDKPDVDYRDIWRLKAKLVLGKEYPDRI